MTSTIDLHMGFLLHKQLPLVKITQLPFSFNVIPCRTTITTPTTHIPTTRFMALDFRSNYSSDNLVVTTVLTLYFNCVFNHIAVKI
jgi:hypothetical protein